MRVWLIRYLSYLGGVAALVTVALFVAGGVLILAERFGPLSLDGPWISSVGGPLGVPVTLAMIYAVPMIIGGAAGCPMFRTIAQFGWIHALPWSVIGLDWVLSSALIFTATLGIIVGFVTIFEAVAVFVILLLTAGFAWHCFTQKWAACPHTGRTVWEVA